MISSPSFRFAVRAFPLLCLPLLLPSCDDTGSNVCGAQLNAQIDSMIDAASALETRTATLEMGILVACENIVKDLSGVGAVPARTGTLDDQVTTACSAAVTAINTAKVGGTLAIAYAPPVCYVNAEAQFNCEASCDVSGVCDPGEIRARCTPGDLSVICEGMCEVGATCEGTATAACDGTCEGVCNGTCSGTTNAAGECAGRCTGTCNGSCTLQGQVQCSGGARCRGGCSVDGTLPRCEGEVTPPSCNIDADCQAGCEGQASFDATCEPARLVVDFTGSAANLASTLQTNLPVLLEVRDSLGAAVADVTAFATAGANVGVALTDVPACAAVRAAELTASLQAAAAAAASVTVSVEVSVSVTGSASL